MNFNLYLMQGLLRLFALIWCSLDGF